MERNTNDIEHFKVDLERSGALEEFLDSVDPSRFYGILHMSSAPSPRCLVSGDMALLRRHWRQSVEVPVLLSRWARQPGSTVRRLVLIGSTAGTIAPNPNQGAYSLGKAAMEHLVRLLVSDLAAQKATVNIIVPSLIPAGMNQGVPERILKSLEGRIPTGRLTSPQDIISVIGFLLSSVSEQINGACIPINGGGGAD